MKIVNSEKRSTGDLIFRIVFNALMAVVLFVFLISAAVFLVLALKPLYYWFIDLFKIEAYSGYGAEELKANYDALIDYNMFWGPKELVFPDHGMVTTEETMAHFVDVKRVFVFFQYLAIGSAALLIPGCVVAKKKNISLWPKITLALILAVIFGVGAGLVFFWDQFFIKFHEIVFPGKTNWYINANYDRVILILPSEVFLADAAAILITIALGIILFVVFFRKKNNKAAAEGEKDEKEPKKKAGKGRKEGKKGAVLTEAKEAEALAEETAEEAAETVEETAEAAAEEAEEAVEEAAETAEEAVKETVEETREAAEEAVQEAGEKAEEAAETVEEKVEETVEETRAAAEEAVSEAEKKAEEAVSEAEKKAEEAVSEAEKKAEEAEGSTTEKFEEMDEEIAKTVEAFAESFEELDF